MELDRKFIIVLGGPKQISEEPPSEVWEWGGKVQRN
jgi:heat shock protein HslJ